MSNANSGDASAATGEAVSIAAVHPKLPPFYRENCTTWLEQVEAQFALSNISSERTRFYHCLANLPEDIASLLDLGGDRTFSNLRSQILTAFGPSEAARLNAVLQQPSLEGLRPSLAAQKMKRDFRAAGITPEDRVVRHRLLQALPISTQVALAAHHHLPLQEFATLADTVMELTAGQRDPGIAAIKSGRRRTPVANSRDPSPAQRDSSPSHFKTLTPYKKGQRPLICRSHIFYADQARTCRPWCQWPGPRPAKSQNSGN
jgi:hypothetical protein